MLTALTVLTGVLYPLLITAAARLFPHAADGSVLLRDGQAIGARHIGQHFAAPGYFWGRLSATTPVPFAPVDRVAGTGSTGTNHAPANPALLAAARARLADLLRADPTLSAHDVPSDLLTASASGLDAHISTAGARAQVRRVARARGLSEAAVADLVATHTQTPWLGLVGDPVVHVLALNLALDTAQRRQHDGTLDGARRRPR